MTEPTTGIAGPILLGSVTGAVALAFLASIGIDPARLLAGLLGSIIAIAFFPPKNVTGWKLALLVFGSMLLASLAGPLIAPGIVAVLAPIGVAAPHATAVSCALIGAFPKPLISAIQSRVDKWLKKYGVKDVDKPPA